MGVMGLNPLDEDWQKNFVTNFSKRINAYEGFC